MELITRREIELSNLVIIDNTVVKSRYRNINCCVGKLSGYCNIKMLIGGLKFSKGLDHWSLTTNPNSERRTHVYK